MQDAGGVSYLGEVKSDTTAAWVVTLAVDDNPVAFKVDTGADVTVIGVSCCGS